MRLRRILRTAVLTFACCFTPGYLIAQPQADDLGSIEDQIVEESSAWREVLDARTDFRKMWQLERDVVYEDGTEETLVVRTMEQYGSGLHYKDQRGAWLESRVEASVMKDGQILFDKLPVKITFAPNADSQTVVQGVRKGGVAQSAVAGLCYYDPASGYSALIATVQSSSVHLHENGVAYPYAFDGVDADIVYRVHTHGLEQDIVINGGLPDPVALGMNAETTVLCILTELNGLEGEPLIMDRPEGRHIGDPSAHAIGVKAQNSKGDLEALFDFQKAYAFSGEGSSRRGRAALNTRIYTEAGRWFLSEELPLTHVLDAQPGLGVFAKVKAGVKPVKGWVQLPIRNQRTLAGAPVDEEVPRYASRGQSGYIIDYVDYSGTVTNDMTFVSGETVYISTNLVLSGCTLTVEPGAIVKLAPGGIIHFISGATIDSESHLGDRAVFTAAADASVGEAISGYSGDPSTQVVHTALSFSTTGTNTLSGVEVRYATAGANQDGGHLIVQNSIIKECAIGIDAPDGAMCEVINTVFSEIKEYGVFVETTDLNVEHCSFYGITNFGVYLGDADTDITIRDSLFVDVSNTYYYSSTLGTEIVSNNATYNVQTGQLGTGVVALTSNPFRTSSLGWSFYLNQTGGVINAGHTSADSLGLYHYTTSTNQVKETNSIVDIGFHYPALVDTDGDGLYDFLEDTDGDGIADITETDWQDSDTDDDGYDDRQELYIGTDPLAMNDHPTSSAGLMGQWKANENTGTIIYEEAGNSYNGGLYNGVGWTNGVLGSAIEFDDNYNRVIINSANELEDFEEFTFSTWVYPDAFTSAHHANFIRRDVVFFFGFLNSKPRQVALDIDDGVSPWWQGNVKDTTLLNTNEWTHVAATYRSGQVSFYINGELSSEHTKTYTMGHSANVTVFGNAQFKTQPFDGRMNDVRIYNWALHTNDVQDVYNADEDGDGLPNWWETEHGFDYNSTSGSDGADGDPDVDLLTNYEEYLHGTDPNLASITDSNNTVVALTVFTPTD